MNTKEKTSIALLILALPLLGQATENPCTEIKVSQQVAQCAKYRKDKSDTLLNLTYKNTIEKIKNQYINHPKLSRQYTETLKTAQRAWLRLRDADCKLEAFQIEETAEAYQTTLDNCTTKFNYDRIKFLDEVTANI